MSIGHTIRRLRREAPGWRTTALAEVAAQWHDPFRVLIACLLSLRTKDETTGPAAARLFALADTPEGMRRLTPRAIERAIYPVGFYRTKARVLREISRDLLARFGGAVPDDIDALLTLKGVGRKTANLVVTQGFNKPGICVDVHVHRISNRWGYVKTRTPEETEMALRRTPAPPLLDRLQRPARVVRPEHLPARLAALLGVPDPRGLPAPRRRPLALAGRPLLAQAAQEGEGFAVRAGLGLLRRLERHRHPREAPVVHQPAERLHAQVAAADLLVAVEAGAEGLPRVVEVERAHASYAEQPRAARHRAAVAVGGADVVAGREEMAGVEADAHAGGLAHRGHDARPAPRRSGRWWSRRPRCSRAPRAPGSRASARAAGRWRGRPAGCPSSSPVSR